MEQEPVLPCHTCSAASSFLVFFPSASSFRAHSINPNIPMIQGNQKQANHLRIGIHTSVFYIVTFFKNQFPCNSSKKQIHNPLSLSCFSFASARVLLAAILSSELPKLDISKVLSVPVIVRRRPRNSPKRSNGDSWVVSPQSQETRCFFTCPLSKKVSKY